MSPSCYEYYDDGDEYGFRQKEKCEDCEHSYVEDLDWMYTCRMKECPYEPKTEETAGK